MKSMPQRLAHHLRSLDVARAKSVMLVAMSLGSAVPSLLLPAESRQNQNWA